MRKLLLLALLASGIGLTSIIDVSAGTNLGISKGAAKSLSNIRQATHQCRIVSKCDQRTKRCDQVEVCR